MTSLLDFTQLRVTVTGGTGSFGQTVTRRLLDLGVPEIRIFSRDESKQDAMRQQFADPRLRFVLGDVRQRDGLLEVLQGVDVVFHAAALKQVPSCEVYPEQAIQTNVLGSENVIRAATARGVRKAVFLSTDKAVQPVNAMGMTKALMEKLVLAHARRMPTFPGLQLCCVRYGNVLYSRGSVVPLFVECALAGRPLPITAPDMTRFLLPLDEAVGMVELALCEGRQGDLFIRKSPAVRVDVLAQAVQSLLGTRQPVTVVGVRPGEKIHETLATREEMARASDLGDHWCIPMDPLREGEADTQAASAEHRSRAFASDNAQPLDVEATMDMLRRVPEIAQRLGRA